MEKLTKEGKTIEEAIKKLMEENNLSKEEFLYTSTVKKGKLFQGTVYEVTAFLKSDINNELKEFIRKLVENMGLEVTIEVTNKDDRLTIRLFSNKDKILIGREKAKAIETITYHLPFCPQAAFVKSELQRQLQFDIQFRISADYYYR